MQGLKGLTGLVVSLGFIGFGMNAFAYSGPMLTEEIMGPHYPPGIPDVLRIELIKQHSWDIKVFWKRTQSYNQYIWQAAQTYNISNNLIRAIIMKESAGQYLKTGSAMDIGLMQIKYNTAVDHGFVGSARLLYQPALNINIGSRYFRWQLNRYNDDISDALAAYNQGSVFRWKKDVAVLPNIKRRIAEKYGNLVRLNAPYNKDSYGPYYNQIYVNDVIKWYNEFNQVIIRQ